MANTFQIKRRLASAPAFDPTRVNVVNGQHGAPGNNEYTIGEFVVYNGRKYRCKAYNNALLPDVSPAYWEDVGAASASGAPVSLANGELAYNEVDDTMYYGMASGGVVPVANIGGSGNYVTRSTAQTIDGDKAFTASVVLSSAVVTTAVLTASGAEVASTEFVQNVFSVIDGGYFDDVAPPVPPAGSGKYFFAQTHDYDKNKWWTLDSWYTDYGHSVHATSLPAASADVVVLGTVEPTVDLDRQDWVQPNSINSGTAGIVFTSSNYGNVSCDITGPAIFNGTATYNK